MEPEHQKPHDPTLQPSTPISLNEPQSIAPRHAAMFEPAPQAVFSGGSVRPSTGRKKRWILGGLGFFGLIVGAIVAYVLLVYIPNKPEVVLQKAVEAYINTNAAYTIKTNIDQSGPNDPDFSYTAQTNTEGNASAKLYVNTFLQTPQVAAVKADGKLYLNLSNFQDLKTLASHYRNVGQPGLQEAIAMFAESSGVASNQNTWLQVDDFILSQPEAPAQSKERVKAIPGASLASIGAEEVVNGKQTRKYEVSLNADAFKLLLADLDRRAGPPVLSAIAGSQTMIGDNFKLDLWVNLKTKLVEQMTYQGRPFRNAMLDLAIVAAPNSTIAAPAAERLTSKLAYGIVNKFVFNEAMQQGQSQGDKERIADLKGVKAALEIYKARTGHYPERYEMSVNQERFIGSQMPGADLDIFKDPAEALIGRNGSQYAYVPTSQNNEPNCGKFGQPCMKFFVITTLDNGHKFQLNSY